MARPANATIFGTTPELKVRYQWDTAEIGSRWHADGNSASMLVYVAWQDVDNFQMEAVGYCDWDGSGPTLQRVRPLQCPLRSGLWCDTCELVDYGVEENRTDFYKNDAEDNAIPEQDWACFKLTFVRPPYRVLSDAELSKSYKNKEYERFCKTTLMPRPRERVVSGFGFAYDSSAAGLGKDPTAWKVVPEERNFVPDWQVDISVTAMLWPIDAVPFAAILELATTVNSEPMKLIIGGRVWNPGELLFKGLAKPIEVYHAADNGQVTDLALLWSAVRGGWNNYPAMNYTTGVVKYKPVTARRPNGDVPNPDGVGDTIKYPTLPILPRYPSADHQKLFVPAST